MKCSNCGAELEIWQVDELVARYRCLNCKQEKVVEIEKPKDGNKEIGVLNNKPKEDNPPLLGSTANEM